MPAYCTNCGAKSAKKICENCGVRRNTTHNFCAFCGAELSEKASICPHCKEPVKRESIFWNILNLLFTIVILYIFWLARYNQNPMWSIWSLLFSAICCLPFIKLLIRKMTIGKPSLRNILKIARIVIVILLLLIGIIGFDANPPEEYTVYNDEATAAAEVVFHEEVLLKNEASYVLNDSYVTCESTPYKNVEGSPDRLVRVKLDYSAQNGFGGLNRDIYTVEMIFDTSNGGYYRISNGKRIQY